MASGTIRRRAQPSAVREWPSDLHPILQRIFAARGLAPSDAAPARLADLAAPSALGGLDRACELLASAISANRRICIVGDFDADGATGTALAVRGLRMLGARDVVYRVPNRVRDGYGLSTGVVEALADVAPDLIVTVDNGISSHAGVAAARARGIGVIITDHHVPGESLPDADAIVNPLLQRLPAQASEDDDASPRPRHLAGVGVMFYLLLALRARLFPAGSGEDGAKQARPELSSLLDLVALGTVADLVVLDANNRILVSAGLKRIRAGRCNAGIAALYAASGRDPTRAVASDLGFALGPRINAAGRLDDMSLGIECLLADDPPRARQLAERLSAINAERQELQAAMVEQGEAMVAAFFERHRGDSLPFGVVLHETDWHPGVVGLVASKLKERLHRPVVAFAPASKIEECGQGRPLFDSRAQDARTGLELRGSARSIPGFHLRDALAEVDACCPGLIARFGGHAMAAGLTIDAANLARFASEFDAVARRRIDAESLRSCIWSDGELAPHELTGEIAQVLRYAAPWGQGFPEPAFDNVFDVESWRAVGERHLKLQLRLAGHAGVFDAILFNALDAMPPPARLRAVYQLDLNEWNGRERLQLMVQHIEAV